MKTLPKLISLLLLVMIAIPSFGQQYLYLKKTGTAQLKRIGIGDFLSINTSEERSFFIYGRLTSIRQDLLHLDEHPYRILEIKQFRTYNQELLTLSSAMKWGSLMLAGLMVANNLGNADQGPFILPGVLIGSAVVFGGSFGVRWAARKTYRTSQGWRVEVIDFKTLDEDDTRSW
jgi:hypothetical protein